MGVQLQQVRRFRCRSDREHGFAMVALIVTLAVMTVLMTVALPVLTTMAQRERETELVFRGQQYARAIALFQRKYGNALPPNLDVLLDGKFLRRKYKDPITGDDFQLLGPGSPELAAALNAAPVAGQPNQQQSRPGQTQQGSFSTTPIQSAGMSQSGLTSAGQAPGGIMAVASKSTKTSLRVYNGHDKYNEWVFMPTQASLAAGGGARGGRAGGAGGDAGRGGRGGNVPPNSRIDSRGRGGSPQSPFGGPQFLRRYYPRVPAFSLSWAILRVDPEHASSLTGLSGWSMLFPKPATLVLSGRYLRALHLKAEAFTDSEDDARDIADKAGTFLNLFHSAEITIRDQGPDADVKAFFDSLKVEHAGNRAMLTATVPPGFIKKILTEAPAEALPSSSTTPPVTSKGPGTKPTRKPAKP